MVVDEQNDDTQKRDDEKQDARQAVVEVAPEPVLAQAHGSPAEEAGAYQGDHGPDGEEPTGYARGPEC